jgi:hypothetical protein
MAHVGAVVVFPHHVGIIAGNAPGGGLLVLSGNHGGRVAYGVYKRRALAFREL